jgi:hypothetical protein
MAELVPVLDDYGHDIVDGRVSKIEHIYHNTSQSGSFEPQFI